MCMSGCVPTLVAMSGKKPKRPPIDKKLVRARLERARTEDLLVGVRRWIPQADGIEGYVINVGKQWVAIAMVHKFRPDGWCLLRLKDIQAVFIDPDSVESKVLKARGE